MTPGRLRQHAGLVRRIRDDHLDELRPDEVRVLEGAAQIIAALGHEECAETGCGEAATTKGRCTRHYHVNYARRGRRGGDE